MVARRIIRRYKKFVRRNRGNIRTAGRIANIASVALPGAGFFAGRAVSNAYRARRIVGVAAAYRRAARRHVNV